jgi:hypothetical protein
MPSSDLGGIMQWARAACQHGRNKKAARVGRCSTQPFLSKGSARRCLQITLEGDRPIRIGKRYVGDKAPGLKLFGVQALPSVMRRKTTSEVVG